MDIESIFERLRRLDHELAGESVNKNDRCVALITACIWDGIDTGERIIGALVRLGYKPGHVAIIIKHNTGKNPALHRWFIGDEGRHYRLHECIAEAA